jgi:hypothetical protein
MTSADESCQPVNLVLCSIEFRASWAFYVNRNMRTKFDRSDVFR